MKLLIGSVVGGLSLLGGFAVVHFDKLEIHFHPTFSQQRILPQQRSPSKSPQGNVEFIPLKPEKRATPEVEFIPLGTKKIEDEHPLYGKECAGNRGARVKVPAGKTPDGRQIWDWYLCH